jgi:hypothetical protein
MKDVVSCDKLRGDANDRYIRRFPNGTTQYTEGVLSVRRPTQGTETSKYLQEKKINNDSLSSGERTGKSPNRGGVLPRGCRTAFRKRDQIESSGKMSQSR